MPEPASLTAAAISTASSTAAPAAITSPPRRAATSGRAQLSSGIPGRRVERRILGQDRSLELLKLATGLEPELVDQPTPGDAIALKRVGLAPRSVQRDHQLTDQALARRVLAHQRLELPDQPCVLAERELARRFDPQAPPVAPAQAGRSRPARTLVGEISQRLATPQRKRLAQAPAGARRVTRGKRAVAAGHQRLKTADVDWPLGPRAGNRVPASDHIVAERLAQLRDVALDDLDRARGRLLAPQLVDQPISRQHLAAVNQQHSQQRTLLGRRTRAGGLLDHLKRPQDSELDHRFCPAINATTARYLKALSLGAFTNPRPPSTASRPAQPMVLPDRIAAATDKQQEAAP